MPVTRIRTGNVGDGELLPEDFNSSYVDGPAANPSLRTLGEGPLQAASGDDIRLALNDEFFKHSSLFGSTLGSRFYIVGHETGSLPTGNPNIPVNRVFTMPFIVTTAFTLTAAGIANTNAPGGATVNLGLYDSVNALNLVPNSLIAQTGLISVSTIGPPLVITGLAIPLEANNVYWLAVVFGASQTRCKIINASNMRPILGFGNVLDNQASVGYSAPFTAGSFPDPYPASLVSPYNGNNIPRLLYAR